MGRELPVPDTYLLVDEDTQAVISTKGTKKILKPDYSRNRGNRNEASYKVLFLSLTKRVNKHLAKIVAAAKYGRWPLSFEHVCHEDGNPQNNHPDNLSIKDHLNNTIDELFIGRSQTTLEYLDLAIERLMCFREKLLRTLKLRQKIY